MLVLRPMIRGLAGPRWQERREQVRPSGSEAALWKGLLLPEHQRAAVGFSGRTVGKLLVIFRACVDCSFASFPQMRLLALVVLALLAVTHAEEGARLLASKSLLNRYAVEGRDLTLQYNIYNVGSR